MTPASERDEWRTPPGIVRQVAAIYGAIALDAACTTNGDKTNAVRRHGTSGEHSAPCNRPPDWNGLTIEWNSTHTFGPGAIWCNPPYSNIRPWVEKAISEFGSRPDHRPIVMLLPANTDTRWFHLLAAHPCVRIEFVPGRIDFLRPDGTPGGRPRGGSIFAHFTKRITP